MNLCVSEKPSVAMAIAQAIGAKERHEGYMIGNGYVVTWCIGHLVEPAEPDFYDEKYKKWALKDLPIIPSPWEYRIKEQTKEQFEVVKALMNETGDDRFCSPIDTVICCTDAGREGEMIFRLVYEMAGCSKPVKRLWISSMEEAAILEGFSNLKPGSDYDNLYASALCRQKADWLVGLNGTRLFSTLYGGKTLKVGRVQSPTLAMLVDREMEIKNFKKKPFYTVALKVGDLEVLSERFEDKVAAEELAKNCKGQQLTVKSIENIEKSISAPRLFDLTSLQREANKLFGFTAKQTLDYTQSLYEEKLVTYPRTDSQYLTEDMADAAGNVNLAILGTMPFVTMGTVTGAVQGEAHMESLLNSKKVTDHHAIIPTMELAEADLDQLSSGQRKILFLIAERFMEAVSDSYEYTITKVVLTCGGHDFAANKNTVKRMGFKLYEKAFRDYFGLNRKDSTADDSDDDTDTDGGDSNAVSVMSVGDALEVSDANIKEGTTKPPKHFSEATLLSAMENAGTDVTNPEAERKGLGTSATRADVIEKLVRDGFVKREKKQMLPTEDGMKLITVLPELIKSPSLTAEWENDLTLISKGEKDPEEFLYGIEQLVKDLVDQYHEVSEEEKKLFSDDSGVVKLGRCPKCGADVVKGRFGAYCKGKCGISLGRVFGASLSDSQLKSILEDKKTFVKGLKARDGKTYEAYLIPDGIQEYQYTDKDGNLATGYQIRYRMEFPKRKKNRGYER